MELAKADEQAAAGSPDSKESTLAIANSSTKDPDKNGEAEVLRKRSNELQEELAVARRDLETAKERREFMQEEAEQARDYGIKLAQEIARLQRIQQTLLPDQRASLEGLRRSVATLAELETQEESAREDFEAREAMLREEIAEFNGESRTPYAAEPEAEQGTGESACEEPPSRVTRAVLEGPLTAREGDDAGGGLETESQEATAARKQTRALEGKALLSEGLLRIEAAHKAAAAERDVIAARLSRLRLAVARRQREEDATPGHAELLQYLSRFEELGRHASERQKQLRKCQAERSTLALTRETLADEARLLETISGGVDEASKQKTAREAFLRQFEGMIQGVEASLSNHTRLLDDARDRRRAAEETQEAVSAERKRFLASTRELNEACVRYEGLTTHLSLVRR